MIKRDIEKVIKQSALKYPIVGIVGPRQSGKTTLAKAVFPNFTYLNLESPDIRKFAKDDPRGFLKTYPGNLILDEIQRAPEILSYLQVQVDSDKKMGKYILTGSQHFMIMGAISQSLAGRIALHTLLPFSLSELKKKEAKEPNDIYKLILTGGYPRIYDSKINPTQWYGDYVQTYLDRDLRQLSKVVDLASFERFIRLCAGRTGQILNLSSLANDVGVNHNTVKSWLSVLNASFITVNLSPFYKNFNKRLIKSPKVYFLDTGLACFLLGIDSEITLKNHPLYGHLFETFIVSEYLKTAYNYGKLPSAFFWRDKSGNEIDLLIEKGQGIFPVEIKSGQTISSDYFSGLNYLSTITDTKKGFVVYGGEDLQKRSKFEVCPWSKTDLLFKKLL